MAQNQKPNKSFSVLPPAGFTPYEPSVAERSPRGYRVIHRNKKGRYEVDNITPAVELPPDVMGSPIAASRPASPGFIETHRHLGKQKIKELLRRSSYEVKKGYEIVKMNEAQRKKFFAGKQMAVEREIEEQRRDKPTLHPRVQASGSPSDEQNVDDAYSYHAIIKRINQTREPARAQTQGNAPGARFKIGSGEKFAARVSEATDVFKSKNRNETKNSAMDFADSAPVGGLEPCTRCKNPTTQFLVNGVCRKCIEHIRQNAGPVSLNDK